MLSDVYTEALLTAAASLPPARRLDAPDATATRVSRVCGSEVSVDLAFDGEVISDIAVRAKACALGQAAAGLFAARAVGASFGEVLTLRDEMQRMLTGEGPAPSGDRWTDLEALLPIREYPQRHASTLLVFQAAADCVATAQG
ncbi:MAG: iron-sulfur cluster assembly scaffold protein [Pseudomonadota bacterium]